MVWKDPTWNRTNTLSFWDNRAYVTTHDSVSGDLLHAKCVDDGGPVPTFTELKQAYVANIPHQSKPHPTTDTDTTTTHNPHRYTSAAKLASGDVQYFKSPSCTGAASPWVLQLGGDAFAFCDQFSASGFGVGSSDVFSFSGPGFVGKAFGVTTSASSQPVLTSAPLDRDGNALSCPVVPPVADRNAAAAATLRRLREAEVEEEEEAEQQVDEHGRKLTLTKICIFVHGAGPDTDETVASSYPEFWGNAYQLSEASRCSQALYIKRNMVDYGWDDLAMQDYFCSIATAYDSHSDTYNIHSKIIFSHGMGTLLVGAALAANKCHMKGSSKWYAIASPLGGTPGADYLNSLCTNYNTYIDQMNAEFHLCSGSGSSRTLNDAYQSLMTTYVPNGITFADVTAKVQAEVDGAMCGTSAWGLDNSQSYSLDSLSDEANLASNNDGFVEWSPCSTGPTTRATALGESWHTHYSYAFYKPSVNHLDLTCRNGDGVYNYRKPCKWIQELT